MYTCIQCLAHGVAITTLDMLIHGHMHANTINSAPINILIPTQTITSFNKWSKVYIFTFIFFKQYFQDFHKNKNKWTTFPPYKTPSKTTTKQKQIIDFA